MLSNHILCETVEKTLYPKAKEIEEVARGLFHKQFASSWPGEPGHTGNNELDYTIQLLDGAINMLLDVARSQKIEVTRYMDLNPKEDYASQDGRHWAIATHEQLVFPNRVMFLLKKDGTLRISHDYRHARASHLAVPIVQKAIGPAVSDATENTSSGGGRPFWPECISKLFRKGERHA